MQVGKVPPSLHPVPVRGRIGGKNTGTSCAAMVKPGEITRIELTLVE